MLMPKKVKHRKQMKGRMTGTPTRGVSLAFGEFGLQAVTRGDWARPAFAHQQAC